MTTENELHDIIGGYQKSFIAKTYGEENTDIDLLMNVFGISPELKKENKQYWGRELGKCWESLVVSIFKNIDGFKPALKVDADEPCDFRINDYAVDTKYRVGSGDSGTLKKFKQYGALLSDKGYTPVFLFLREDNLPAAITACRKGGWAVLCGQDSFDFILDKTGFDFKQFLIEHAKEYDVGR